MAQYESIMANCYAECLLLIMSSVIMLIVVAPLDYMIIEV